MLKISTIRWSSTALLIALVLPILVSLPTRGHAQCYLPQLLTDRLQSSDLSVIGTVTDSTSYYGDDGMIYTDYEVQVDWYIVSPGSTVARNPTLTMTTVGGRIGTEALVVYPSLRNIVGVTGMYMLRIYTGDDIDATRENIYIPSAVHESLATFDELNGNFYDGETKIGDVSQLLRTVQNVKPMTVQPITDREFTAVEYTGGRMTPVISGFGSRTVSAGTGQILTINGSGFGTTPGKVEFDSPDDGPGRSFIIAKEGDIVEWSDTRIRVYVVSEAGSGTVRVVTADNQRAFSPSQIDVEFAITNLSNAAEAPDPGLLVDDESDGNGGYILNLSNNTANNGVSFAGFAPARTAFARALATWQQEVGYNVVIGGTTGIQEATRDGVNVVGFDNDAFDFDDRYGNGTVGIAFSYYQSCSLSEPFELVEMDIFFRRNGNPNNRGGSVNYDFGPDSGFGTDFESVALHELGHTIQLKHVNDVNSVMSYRILNGTTQRVLNSGTIQGANLVTNLSLAYDAPFSNCSDPYELFDGGQPVQLPVELTAFSVRQNGKRALLEWNTASELDNEGFFIERSRDGRNFDILDWVPGRGTVDDNSNYTWSDVDPLAGDNFYRLMQTDFDGTQTPSPVRFLKFGDSGKWEAWPNPTADRLVLSWASEEKGRSLIVRDVNGRVLSNRTVADGQSRIDVDLSQYPMGLYLLDDGRGNVMRVSKR